MTESNQPIKAQTVVVSNQFYKVPFLLYRNTRGEGDGGYQSTTTTAAAAVRRKAIGEKEAPLLQP